MPCVYYETDEEKAAPYVTKLNAQKKELDRLSRLLCFVAHHTDIKGIIQNMLRGAPVTKEDRDNHADLMAWWEKHQEDDRKAEEKAAEAKRLADKKYADRLADNKARQAGLKKLTNRERKALGIS